MRNSKEYFDVEEIRLLPDDDACGKEARRDVAELVKHLNLAFLAQMQKARYSERSCFQNVWRFLRSSPWFFHLAILTIYTSLFVLAYFQAESHPAPDALIYTPAEPATIHEARMISVKINPTNNIYNSPPSPEVDQAWAALFRNANVRVSRDELEKTGRSSVELEDESGGFLGALDVYHQLHCLKYIREYIHQDYYTIKKTNVPKKDHVNHCIEMLRQIVMCKADTALMTYSWLPDFRAPWPDFGIEHQCVNWESIEEWGNKRRIDIFEKGLLVHPTMGPSYHENDVDE